MTANLVLEMMWLLIRLLIISLRWYYSWMMIVLRWFYCLSKLADIAMPSLDNWINCYIITSFEKVFGVWAASKLKQKLESSCLGWNKLKFSDLNENFAINSVVISSNLYIYLGTVNSLFRYSCRLFFLWIIVSFK